MICSKLKYMKFIWIKNNLFYLICLCLIVFSSNYQIIESIRILDILFFVLYGSFFITQPKINQKQFILLLFIVIIFSISAIMGVLIKGSFEKVRLIFVYKYFLIFTIPWLIISIIKTEKQVRIVNKLLLINFILLSSWSYIYVYILSNGLIDGDYRPGFPFGSYRPTAAHLFSCYLGFFFAAYLLYLKDFFNHNFILSSLIIFNSVLGLLSTGSRTGILLAFIATLFYGILKLIIFLRIIFFNKLLFKKKMIIKCVYILVCLVPIILFLPPFINEYISNNYSLIQRDFHSTLFNDYYNLIQRSLEFNLANDETSQNRIQKFMEAINEVKYSRLLLGLGFNTEKIWYDGIFAILLAHGGLLFIISIFIFYFFLLKKIFLNSLNQNSLIFLFLVFLYAFSNFITEYVMIFRNSFPVLVLLSILYMNILKNYKITKSNNTE